MKRTSIRSMTAFGRTSYVSKAGKFLVEIQSINRRHLEIHLALPRLLSRFEMEIRKWIEAKIARGQISLNLQWAREEGETVKITPNLALVRALKKAWDGVAAEVGIKPEITLSLLANEKDILLFEEEIVEESLYRESLQKAVEEALNQLIVMREKEGSLLSEDLLNRIALMKSGIEKISANAGNATEKYREKLKLRLEELFTGHPENEEKVLREVAVFAERIDVTEEIVRFRSHLQQMEQLLKTSLEGAESRGKMLEFLIQELHREINTIGSKSSDLTISQEVIRVKAELEKIREQIQNIE